MATERGTLMGKDTSQACPRGPWGKTWALACVLIALQLVGTELFWRNRGHRPGIDSNEPLWCYHRDRLEGAGRDTLALLGGSRLQIGFDLDVFLQAHPDMQVVQLSVPARGPYAALRDLAADESFRGTVLCSLEEVGMQPLHQVDQQGYVDYYRQKWGPGKKASLLLSLGPQLMLAQLQPRLGGVDLLRWLRQGQLPPVNYTKTLFSRQRFADYTRVSTESLVKTRVRYVRTDLEQHPPVSPAEWAGIVAEVAGFVRRIEARGGKVAIVRYPFFGQLLALQDEFFPREKYWDPFVAGVGTDVIDFHEMPGYESLHCPDDSHLDLPSTIAFTKWLTAELERRGYLE